MESLERVERIRNVIACLEAIQGLALSIHRNYDDRTKNLARLEAIYYTAEHVLELLGKLLP